MYAIADFRQIGMPELVRVETAEAALRFAQTHGFAEHAFIYPVTGPHDRKDIGPAALGQLVLDGVQ